MPSKSNERLKKRRKERHLARLDQEHAKRVDADLNTLACTLAGQVRGVDHHLVEDCAIPSPTPSPTRPKRCTIM